MVIGGNLEESHRLCNRGLKLMAAGKFKKAIPLFRQATAEAPFVYTPANNLALCLFATEQLEEAIRIQSESLELSPLANPFGLASLATFHFINGDETTALRCLDELLEMKLPSDDACVKVCETLARFKRHQAILDLADASGYNKVSSVCFYTGVAAANLGKRERARHDLSQVSRGDPHADIARHYLQHLSDESVPYTIRGDWPYLSPIEVCPYALLLEGVKLDPSSWLPRRIAVDFIEAMLNESIDDPDVAIEMLLQLKHPEAQELLWLIAKGTIGPDSLRLKALNGLQQSGMVKNGETMEVFVDGERRKISTAGTKLDPDLRFAKQLPKALDRIYTKAIKAGQKNNPDWQSIGDIYRRVIKEETEFFPARYNYAISLIHRGQMAEAEPILHKLIDQHPEYLFAQATLLQMLVIDERLDEAEDLLKATAIPETTHPDAMVAWLIAQFLYHENAECFDEALACIRAAHEIAPDHPMVKRIMQDY